MQDLDGGRDEVAACGSASFAVDACADGLQILAAGSAVAIEKIEGDLGVKERLADALEGEELRGLRFELFDAAAACFGNGTKEDQRYAKQTDTAEGAEKFRSG